MIAEHVFNSAWWGESVGITVDLADLMAPADAIERAGAPFAWVEARVPAPALPFGWLGPTNGFQYVDTQLAYRANLRRLDPLPTDVALVTAAEHPIDTSDFAPFSTERYARLPGIDADRLADRYARWADDLVAASPSTCASVFHRHALAGYVFGSVSGSKGAFTLAVASRTTATPGLSIYLAASHLLRDAGATTMSSALSATNLAAINAHVALRCLFVSATTVWIRTRPSVPAASGQRP